MSEETELLSLSKNYSIKIKFSHTVADGKSLISVTEGIDRTGLLVWRGARVFYEWCVNDNNSSNDWNELDKGFLKKMDIIELGGGLGFGSMIAGGLIDILSQKQVPALSPMPISVLCTDFFLPALELADEQIKLNNTSSAEQNPQEQHQNLSKIVSTAQLDWCWALSKKVEDQQKLDDFCSRYILTNRSSNQLLLLALDCVYPDTRNDVLCGLFVTIAKLLNVKMQERTSDKPFLIMTFVERDVGLTLRRLITAASVCGLKVDPLELPVLADKSQEIKLFGQPSISQNRKNNNFSFVRDCILSSSSQSSGNSATGDEDEIWSKMQNSFIFHDLENENKTWFSCAGATWILKIQLHQSNSSEFSILSHESCIALAGKCNSVIESLTAEVDGFLQAQKSGESVVEEGKLQTLISAGLFDPSHFNSKWWITLGYLCFKDSYLAARALRFHIEQYEESISSCSALNLSLDKRLVAKVLQERADLVDEKFMQMEIEDLFLK